MTSPPIQRSPAGRALRLHRRREIREVFRRGVRAGDGGLLLIALPREGNAVRGGVIVSRKHGPAVERNRLKRRCREALRLVRPELPEGYDLLLLPRPGLTCDLESLKQSVRELASRIDRKVRRERQR